MKQPYNTMIYNTALYMRLSRDDELQGESGSIQTPVSYTHLLWGFPKGATPPFGTRLCEAKCSVLYACLLYTSNMIMRGEGILKKAMLITGTGAVLNIILDPIMIIIMKNQGKGVEGAAYAAGTNFGAKQYDRVKQVTKAFIIGATVIGLIFYVPIQLAPGTILSWFIKDKDLSLIHILGG